MFIQEYGLKVRRELDKMGEMRIAIENDAHVYDAMSLYLCVWVWDVYKELSTGKMSKRPRGGGSTNKQTNEREKVRERSG